MVTAKTETETETETDIHRAKSSAHDHSDHKHTTRTTSLREHTNRPTTPTYLDGGSNPREACADSAAVDESAPAPMTFITTSTSATALCSRPSTSQALLGSQALSQEL
jgi:hypothetical protein